MVVGQQEQTAALKQSHGRRPYTNSIAIHNQALLLLDKLHLHLYPPQHQILFRSRAISLILPLLPVGCLLSFMKLQAPRSPPQDAPDTLQASLEHIGAPEPRISHLDSF